MNSGSLDPPDSGLKSDRRAARLSAQVLLLLFRCCFLSLESSVSAQSNLQSFTRLNHSQSLTLCDLPVFRWGICVFQDSNSKAKEHKKGGNSLQEVKRRGRMERVRGEQEDMSEKLKMLVRFQPSCFWMHPVTDESRFMKKTWLFECI